jgi:hypothetical protein
MLIREHTGQGGNVCPICRVLRSGVIEFESKWTLRLVSFGTMLVGLGRDGPAIVYK